MRRQGRAVERVTIGALIGIAALTGGSAAAQTRLTPIEEPAPGAERPGPWRLVALKNGTPATAFESVDIDGVRALRIRADQSYGNWIHPWQGPASTIAWRWRLDRPIATADLRLKAADDAALKVCVFFDLPLSRLPWSKRALLQLARSSSGEALPAATVCYVWDSKLPLGTVQPNAYTRRLRYLVIDGDASPLREWRTHRRDIAADFRRAFPEEAGAVPPVSGVAIGADTDNTKEDSLGYLRDLVVLP